LTVSLTAALLGVIAAVSRMAPSSPPTYEAMQVFDVSGAEQTSEPAPQPNASGPGAQKPAASVQSVPTPMPAMEQTPAPALEAMPTPPVVAPGIGAQPEAAAPAARGASPRHQPDMGEVAERHVEADQYGRTVFREIHARQAYPAALARAGVEGTVVVELQVSARGRIVAAVVLISSQAKLLDQLALAQVRSTSLPPPPRGQARTFRIPMTYRVG
jgi:protein TonB